MLHEIISSCIDTPTITVRQAIIFNLAEEWRPLFPLICCSRPSGHYFLMTNTLFQTHIHLNRGLFSEWGRDGKERDTNLHTGGIRSQGFIVWSCALAVYISDCSVEVHRGVYGKASALSWGNTKLTFWMIYLRVNIPVQGVNWSFGATPSHSHGSRPGGQSTAGAEGF